MSFIVSNDIGIALDKVKFIQEEIETRGIHDLDEDEIKYVLDEIKDRLEQAFQNIKT